LLYCIYLLMSVFKIKAMEKRRKERQFTPYPQNSQGSDISELSQSSTRSVSSNCESLIRAMRFNGVIYNNNVSLSKIMMLQVLTREVDSEDNGSTSVGSSATVESSGNTSSTIINPNHNGRATYNSITDFTLAREQILTVPGDEIDNHVIQTLAYIKHVNLASVTVTGGKRKRRYSLNNKRTMKRRGKLMKGGSISDWICAHPDFLTSAILLSFVGGGFWCLGTYVIPVAMKELYGVVWNYIVKTCETSAVIIANLFKTNGGTSKFIDLLLNVYSNQAFAAKALNDAYGIIIKPTYFAIRDIIVAWCKPSVQAALAAAAAVAALPPQLPGGPPTVEQQIEAARTAATEAAGGPPTVQQQIAAARAAAVAAAGAGALQPVLAVQNDISAAVNIQQAPQAATDMAGIQLNIKRLDDVCSISEANKPQVQAAADELQKQLDELLRTELASDPRVGQELATAISSVREAREAAEKADAAGGVAAVAAAEEAEGGVAKGGENILSYLSRNIKKTMKRRKRSHKKHSGKKINYKSHKKNSRT
jgi:hypothetical protein